MMLAEQPLNRIRGQAHLLELAAGDHQEFSASQSNALFQQAETILEQVKIIQDALEGVTLPPDWGFAEAWL